MDFRYIDQGAIWPWSQQLPEDQKHGCHNELRRFCSNETRREAWRYICLYQVCQVISEAPNFGSSIKGSCSELTCVSRKGRGSTCDEAKWTSRKLRSTWAQPWHRPALRVVQALCDLLCNQDVRLQSHTKHSSTLKVSRRLSSCLR